MGPLQKEVYLNEPCKVSWSSNKKNNRHCSCCKTHPWVGEPSTMESDCKQRRRGKDVECCKDSFCSRSRSLLDGVGHAIIVCQTRSHLFKKQNTLRRVGQNLVSAWALPQEFSSQKITKWKEGAAQSLAKSQWTFLNGKGTLDIETYLLTNKWLNYDENALSMMAKWAARLLV